MEIRCGSCNKLFRVSDDKITGKGIKFACTRCGEYVRITREDFDNYTLSQTTVSVLDMFEQKPKPSAEPVSEPAATEVSEPAGAFDVAAAPVNLPEETPVPEPASTDLSATSELDFLQEREEPAAFDEPLPFEEAVTPAAPEPVPSTEQESRSSPVLEEPQPGPAKEENRDTLPQPSRGAEPQPGGVLQPESQPAPLPEARPAAAPQQKAEPRPAPPIVPIRDLKPEPHPQRRPEPVSRPAFEAKPMSQPRQAAAAITTPAVSTGVPAAPKKETPRAAAPSPPPPMAVVGASPAAPARSNVMILVVALIVLGLAGAGVYLYKRSSTPPAREPATNLMLTEGLHISNASGSLEPNGDLLISGAVENSSDKEKAAWYVVVDVFDASGRVMNKLKLLNGKQLYTRSDYDILSKRGVNIQELKTRALQQQGFVIPPKGNISFEIRYLQPPVGVASFNASIQPFDPERLFKEIAEEAK